MVLVHLLDIPIYSYDTTHGWNRYTPGNVYGVFDLSQFNSLQIAMYVRHDINHYDVVTSVQLRFKTTCTSKISCSILHFAFLSSGSHHDQHVSNEFKGIQNKHFTLPSAKLCIL